MGNDLIKRKSKKSDILLVEEQKILPNDRPRYLY